MEREDGRSISEDAKQERRNTIVRMRNAGRSYKEIQEATGASHDLIWRTCKAWTQGGKKAIAIRKRGRKVGEKRHLSLEQEKAIQKVIIDRFPDQLKLDFALWNRVAVQQLILQKYHFQMPIRTVGEYLKRWGFTPQKPAKFAMERKPEKVRQWLMETYPQITERAKHEGAEIYWGDETGLRASDVRGRGFAPKGKTPIVNATAAYENLSMVSAITNKGKVNWMIVEGTINADRFIEFLTRLTQDAPRKIFLVLDNLKVHHARVVKEWLETRSDVIELFFLPPYSPDLNPDEHLNADLKYGVGSRAPVRTKAKLRNAAETHMAMLEQTPERIIKYFEDPAIRYAAV